MNSDQSKRASLQGSKIGSSLERVVLLLLSIGWEMKPLKEIIHSVALSPFSNSEFRILRTSLQLAYDLKISQADYMQQMKECGGIQKLNNKIHNNFLHCFSKANVKSNEQLFNDIKNSNGFATDSLSNDFISVKNIFEWLENLRCSDITKWADHTKRNPGTSRYEKMAYVWKAMELFNNFKVRDIQIISLIMLYNSGSNKMVQIETGEGKTIIIAMLATLLALDGNKVDIVTTSPELSVPQSNQLKKFYNVFGLSSSNIDEGKDEGVKRKAYKCDVVYGFINEFEADALREEYLRQNIRGNRPYEIVIADEADSILIDGINNVTRLSTIMPGMSYLLPLLVLIWTEMEAINENGNGGDTRDVIVKNTLHGIKQKVNNNECNIPRYLLDFVKKNRLRVWVNSAYHAKNTYKLGRDYIIRDGEIKIVDLYNTGIVHSNMKWTDGLHQFLQLKHNVYLTSEELTTNFMSNPTFFYKYQRNIFGLTGTLGDESTKDFLKNSYNADSIVLPSFKVKQHIALTPIMVTTEDEWHNYIVESCLCKLEMNRAVMIVCESINETEIIKNIFLSDNVNYPNAKILMYQTEKDSKIIAKQIEPGELIITTNICGRGTDIVLTDEVNRHGGLHICLTFLPENIRVQTQNIGRTSRAGHPGTSQIVMVDHIFDDVNERQVFRDQINSEKLKGYYEEIKKIRTRSTIFETFCHLLNVIDRSSPFPADWPSIIRTDALQPELCREVVKERFSIWLKENEIKSDELMLDNYKTFELEIKRDASDGSITNNPFYYVTSGNKYLRQRHFKQAEIQYGKSINKDENFATFAYYNRSVAQYAQDDDLAAASDLHHAGTLMQRDHNHLNQIINFCRQYGHEDAANKFTRKRYLLEKSASVISKVCDGSGARNALSRAKAEGCTLDLLFVNWKEGLPDDGKEYSKEVTELKKNGWNGPITVRKMNSFKKWMKAFF